MTVELALWLVAGFISIPLLAYFTVKFGAVGWFQAKRFFKTKESESERPRRQKSSPPCGKP